MAKQKGAGGHAKFTCGVHGCRFSSPRAERLEHHKNVTLHGHEQRRRVYSKYHLEGGVRKGGKKAA